MTSYAPEYVLNSFKQNRFLFQGQNAQQTQKFFKTALIKIGLVIYFCHTAEGAEFKVYNTVLL